MRRCRYLPSRHQRAAQPNTFGMRVIRQGRRSCGYSSACDAAAHAGACRHAASRSGPRCSVWCWTACISAAWLCIPRGSFTQPASCRSQAGSSRQAGSARPQLSQANTGAGAKTCLATAAVLGACCSYCVCIGFHTVGSAAAIRGAASAVSPTEHVSKLPPLVFMNPLNPFPECSTPDCLAPPYSPSTASAAHFQDR